jgi:hypothetical protein
VQDTPRRPHDGGPHPLDLVTAIRYSAPGKSRRRPSVSRFTLRTNAAKTPARQFSKALPPSFNAVRVTILDFRTHGSDRRCPIKLRASACRPGDPSPGTLTPIPKRNHLEARGRDQLPTCPPTVALLALSFIAQSRVRIQHTSRPYPYSDRRGTLEYHSSLCHHHSVPDCQPFRKVSYTEGAISY